MSRTTILLWHVLFSLIAFVAAIFLAGLVWGHGSYALVYLSPPVLAIWFSDRTILRRAIATVCGEVVTLIFQAFSFMIVLGIFIKSEPFGKTIGPLVIQVGAAWVGYWVTKELLRSNPAAHTDAREASQLSSPIESRAGGRER